MKYTISRTEIQKLDNAREIQTKDAAEEHFRRTGEQLTTDDAPANREWANVRFVNGSTFDLAVPLGKVAEWARLLRPGRRFQTCDDGLVHEVNLTDEIEMEFEAADKIRLRNGGSEMAFFTPSVLKLSRTGKEFAREDLGHALPLVAPECGGAFTVQADTSSLKEKRKAKAADKKDAKRRKEFAKAKQDENHAMNELREAAAAHVANLATLTGPPSFEAVIGGQRLALKARRLLRRALATPEIMPAWLPETYSEERTKPVNVVNPGGGKVKSIWAEDYNLALGVAEYVGGVPDVRGWWFEPEFFIDHVNIMETVDARAEFAAHADGIADARAALTNYTPLKLSGKPFYASHRRGRVVPLLKQDKLALELKGRLSTTAGFIRHMFRLECEKNNLPADLACQYYRPAFEFSRARLAVKSWPARKSSLAAAYVAARTERMEIESRCFDKGLIRACAVDADGKRGGAAILTAAQLAHQLQKCADAGYTVEIVESSNPAWPVGPAVMPAPLKD